jgi:hypothetical protein
MLSDIMLSAIMLSIIMISAIMLSIIILSVIVSWHPKIGSKENVLKNENAMRQRKIIGRYLKVQCQKVLLEGEHNRPHRLSMSEIAI